MFNLFKKKPLVKIETIHKKRIEKYKSEILENFELIKNNNNLSSMSLHKISELSYWIVFSTYYNNLSKMRLNLVSYDDALKNKNHIIKIKIISEGITSQYKNLPIPISNVDQFLNTFIFEKAIKAAEDSLTNFLYGEPFDIITFSKNN